MNVTHYRKQQADEPALGRPRLYDDEERAQRHREAALRWYYKQQARTAPCFFTLMGEKHRESVR
jgi:hypothetical protein